MTAIIRQIAAPFQHLTFERVLLLALNLAPLFVVTVRSWSSGLLIVGSLLCCVALMRPGSSSTPATNTPSKLKHIFVLTLFLPVMAVGVSSVLRADHDWANYDAPARFLIAIPVFLLALRARSNAANALQYVAPVSLILTLLHQTFMPQPLLWGPDRMSTYFSDPLVFGYFSLTLGLISAASIHLLKKDTKAVMLLKLVGLVIGLYLSVQSGSRTGWLAVPVVLGLWLYWQSAGRPDQRKLWGAGLIIVFLATLTLMSGTVSQRLALAINEVATYNWVGMAPETSVGLRITFLRIAADLFASNPLLGFGDTAHQPIALPSHIYNYATAESLHEAFYAGFHNEVVTNAIRFGLAGLLSSLLLFITPIYLFSSHLCARSNIQRANAWLGLVLMLCVCISSLSTEVFDLKYTASFFALMIALLAAGAIAPEPEVVHAGPD